MRRRLIALFATVAATLTVGAGSALATGGGLPVSGTVIDQSHNSSGSPVTVAGNESTVHQGGSQTQTATGGTATSGDATSGGGCCRPEPPTKDSFVGGGQGGGGEAESEAEANAENDDQKQENTNTTEQTANPTVVNAPVASGNNIGVTLGGGSIDQSDNSSGSPVTVAGNESTVHQGGSQTQTAQGGTASSGDATSGGGGHCCSGGGEAESEAEANAENDDQKQENRNETKQEANPTVVNTPVLSGNNVAVAFGGHDGGPEYAGKCGGGCNGGGGSIDQSHNSSGSPVTVAGNESTVHQGGSQTQTATGGTATSGNATSSGGCCKEKPAPTKERCGGCEQPKHECGCKGAGKAESEAEANARNDDQKQKNTNTTTQQANPTVVNAPELSGNNVWLPLGLKHGR